MQSKVCCVTPSGCSACHVPLALYCHNLCLCTSVRKTNPRTFTIPNNSIGREADFKLRLRTALSLQDAVKNNRGHAGATQRISRLTYLSCHQQPHTHTHTPTPLSSLICPVQILDQGACLKNQRSNRKAITLATHQPRDDSNTIISRLQQPAADK